MKKLCGLILVGAGLSSLVGGLNGGNTSVFLAGVGVLITGILVLLGKL